MSNNHYDHIAKASGVEREAVKRVLLAASYSGPPDCSVETAFRAGFKSARSYGRFLDEHGNKPDWSRAEDTGWSYFQSSKAAKGNGGD